MISYLVGLVAFLLFALGPLTQWLSPAQRSSSYAPRPYLNTSHLALDDANATAIDCAPDAYAVHIYSREPLVLYFESFLTEAERAHLLEESAPLWTPSKTSNGERTAYDPAARLSDVALLPRTDAVRCIERRAAALQGWRPEVWVERLRTQKYGVAGHYRHHFDWASSGGGWSRVSSMMAWVAGEGVVGGGTEFPYLEARGGWCRFVECDEGTEGGEREGGKGEEGRGEEGKGEGGKGEGGKGEGGEGKEGEASRERKKQGVVFKVIPGNAVYWENFRPDGSRRGWEETWHAGLPVKEGVKVGLNIWSWGRIE
ncbi:hypothetical protein ACHAQH_001982 [Verticillium albo-atrum]